jgi:hypothetical protein
MYVSYKAARVARGALFLGGIVVIIIVIDIIVVATKRITNYKTI